MNYKLAKKLKDAGFPQREGDWYTSDGEWISEEKREYRPTLSELLSACNSDEDFHTLHLDKDYDKNCWWAESRKQGTLMAQTEGSTPEEAVANLWLELNKKIK